MTLSERQKRQFKRYGFLTLRNVVDQDVCRDAYEAAWEGMAVDRDDPESWKGMNQGSGIPDIVRFKPFEELAQIAFPYAEALVGEGVLAKPSEPPVEEAHHAGVLNGPDQDGMLSPHISYPREDEDSEWTARHTENQGSHVDGYASDDRFGEDINYLPLSVGVAVYFDKVIPGGGGFTVWPGSHLKVSEYFEDHSYNEFVAADGVLADLDIGAPFEVTGESGDLVLWHHNMVHAAGPNVSDRIRMAAIGRFVVDDIFDRMNEEFPDTVTALGDPWNQYPALQDL